MKTIFNNIFNKSNNNSNISNEVSNSFNNVVSETTTTSNNSENFNSILQEIKQLEALQKDEKPQRKTVNLPEKYLKSHLHPFDAQRRCFYRGIILRVLYKVYEEIRREGKENSKPTCDPNFESWLKTDQAKYTYVYLDSYKGTAPNLYNELLKKYCFEDENV